MKSSTARNAVVCRMGLAAAVIAVASLERPAVTSAAERQFLVMLANSPKQFGTDPSGLPNPEVIRRQYYDMDDPFLGSFAEYWEEISYGDVTINHRTRIPEWIDLPWRIVPDPNDEAPAHIELNRGPGYQAGDGEGFSNATAMVDVDLNGDGFADSEFIVPFPLGNEDTVPGSNPPIPVWMPGERFVDMDGDGMWDGFDEASNQMDWNGDGRPDNAGPWIDLNGNGEADNEIDCIYLPDADNDGNPDCCPDGPGTRGCEGFDPVGLTAGACPSTSVAGPAGEIVDCNGNMVPDVCDVSCTSAACAATDWLIDHPGVCGESQDEVPFVSQGTQCVAGAGDGVPDECQFQNYNTGCVDSPPGEEDGCAGSDVCIPLEQPRTQPQRRCEYHDANGNGQLDIVEPFENFLVRWNPSTGDEGGGNWVRVSDDYIRSFYPGDPEKVIAQHGVRTLYNRHDPLNKIGASPCLCAIPCTNSAQCRDALPGSSCNLSRGLCTCVNVSTPGGALPNACAAGTHADYNPPDFWVEAGSTAMRNLGPLKEGLETVRTTEPSWYRQAWIDRYSTEPPPWTNPVQNMQPLEEGRRCFGASRGGLNGRGFGWIGCDSNVDPAVVFVTPEECQIPPIDAAFSTSCNAPILPEEFRGIGTLSLFDSGAEFDDLPSSKYHQYGDQKLGERTSPYSRNIWGQDRGNNNPDSVNREPDAIIPAAGPYATSIHGNYGRDGGNVMQMELLTRRDPDLDGLVSQGEIPGLDDNYVQDAYGRRNGTNTAYPSNRQRLLEDCIAVLDDVIDFDDFVDPIAMNARTCGGASLAATIPGPLLGDATTSSVVSASGILSGIVLLPSGAHSADDFPIAPGFYPIHNEDGLGDANFLDSNLPRTARSPAINTTFTPRISWNLFVHDLVRAYDVGVRWSGAVSDFQAAYSAHEYLHAWEHFPDLYDYDVYDQPGPIVNCPIGEWDVMATGGLVHPVPILKERPCTRWIKPVDLATILTPGVDATITLPPAEFVRDESYYFLENENRAGERFYFWSAGLGFDQRMPGSGALILHTDVGSNPDALPAQQRSATRPTYLIEQADGLAELQAGTDCGDAGDPWPGSTNKTQFNFNTNPSASWYTQNSWTGIDVLDIVPDGAGSVQLKINWVPTNIPSLRFRNPPGGESVNSNYQIRFQATDVYGGTTARVFYTPDAKTCSGGGAACTKHSDCPSGALCRHDLTMRATGATRNLIGELKKTTPGTNELSMNWNITGVDNGRYAVFAKLVPGAGADNNEAKNTTPRRGRNNVGNGTMTIINVSIDTDASDTDDKARSETWSAVCIDAATQKWRVNSTLTQPVLNEADPLSDPYPLATTGLVYNSVGGEVSFAINPGSTLYEKGDSFSFTTTGITPVSRGVSIINGQISLDPVAVITAAPLSGDPPLMVAFDGRSSFDPNGSPLTYRWDFGDASGVATGGQVSHTFEDAGTYTVVLRATNPLNARFGEAQVDIEVTNNSPNAVVSATPTSGPAPLNVQFTGGQSTDRETPANALIYHWDFGDGKSANDALVPGTAFLSVSHLYRTRANGSTCTSASPCTFSATLTVIDAGGKEDADTITIRVGNSNPVPVITYTGLQGPDPWEVVFNAINSTDSDGDSLTIEWIWGDGTPNQTLPITGIAGDGKVPHQYQLPTGETSGSFRTRAVLRDNRGGETAWSGVTVTVNEATVGSSDPFANFTIVPDPPLLGKEFTVNASLSFDRPVGGQIASYTWNWGDGTAASSGVTAKHTYDEPGTYTIALTVADAESPPNTNTRSRTFSLTAGGPVIPGVNQPPVAVLLVNPTTGFAATTAFTFDARGSSDPDGNDGNLTYLWEFGDGDESTLSVATHVYDVPNLSGYVIRLTVTDEDNLTTEASQVVVVRSNIGNVAPVAFIATGLRTGSAPLTITFDGRNSYDPNGDLLDFQWEFRVDGELIDAMTGATVTKTFDTPGTYTVDLDIADGRGGTSHAGPETIVATAPVAPSDEPQPRPDGEQPSIPDSARQRPGGAMCGLGMLMTLFMTITGLSMMALWRRRFVL